MTTWNLNTPPDETERLGETRDALALAEHRLAAHAVAWVTAAERLGLEIREEEPEETMRRVLAVLEGGVFGVGERVGRGLEREAVVVWLRGESLRQRDLGNTITADAMHRMAARIVGCEHLIGGTRR